MPKESFKLLTNQIRKERDFSSQVVDFVTLKIPDAVFGKIVKVEILIFFLLILLILAG